MDETFRTYDLTGVALDSSTWVRLPGLDFAQITLAWAGYAPPRTIRLRSKGGGIIADGIGGPGTRAAIVSANRDAGFGDSAILDDALWRYLLRRTLNSI